MNNIILTKYISKKYKLKDRNIITSDTFFEILNNENIELHDLILILGINQNNEKKIKEKVKCKMRINLNPIQIKTQNDIKKAISLIRVDLKYLEQYKQRYYTKKEIEKICKKYDVKFMWFIKYIYPRKKNYYENLEILENSKKGLWIGEKIKIDEEFLQNNLVTINKECNCISKQISRFYNCNWLKEDLEFEAFMSILENGIIQKNYEYDKKLVINKLKYNAKFIAFKYMISKFKQISYEKLIENENINKIKINLVDNSYNPEEILEKTMGIKNIEIKDIHRDIIEEIKIEIQNDTSRDNILKNVAKKLNIRKNIFNNYIEKIREIIIYYGLVKVCKNGQIITMSEEE